MKKWGKEGANHKVEKRRKSRARLKACMSVTHPSSSSISQQVHHNVVIFWILLSLFLHILTGNFFLGENINPNQLAQTGLFFRTNLLVLFV